MIELLRAIGPVVGIVAGAQLVALALTPEIGGDFYRVYGGLTVLALGAAGLGANIVEARQRKAKKKPSRDYLSDPQLKP